MLEQKSFFHLASIYLIAVLLVVLNVSDIRIAGLSKVMPLFDLMAVFYFAAFRQIFGLWFVFLLGIWNDALGGNPLGTTALCYIILIKFFSLLNDRMLIRENFHQVWHQFIFFCFLFLLMKWVVLSIFSGSLYNIINPIIQLVLSSIFYVIMHKFFDYLSKKLLGDN
jgi:rod shape-determining protein MreD